MPRLPVPGQDDNTWGSILNDFLLAAHNSDGTLQPSAITTAGGYIKPSTGIPEADLSSALQSAVTNANSALQPGTSTTGDLSGTYANTTVSKVNGVALPTTAPSGSGQVLTSTSTTTTAWQASPSAPVASVAGKTGTVTLVEADIANLTSDLAATEKSVNKGAANGYAPLDGSILLPSANLPTIPIGKLPTGTTSSTVAIGNDSRITGALQSNTVTTKGDLLAATAASTITRVGVGADGQVLTADSTQGTGVKWATPTASPVSSVFSRTGAVTAQSGDYTASQVTNAADKSSASAQIFTGNLTAPAHGASGLTGATNVARLVGGNVSGAPTSGTFAVRDVVINADGTIYVCTAAGTPGTWVQVGGTPANVPVQLGTTVLASTQASITVSVPAGYNIIQGYYTARNDSGLTDTALRFNGDTAANYKWQVVQGAGGVFGAQSTSANYIRLATMPSSAQASTWFGSGEFTIPQASSTAITKQLSGTGIGVDNTTYFETFGGMWTSTAAITSVTIMAISGNLVAGSSLTLYGMI